MTKACVVLQIVHPISGYALGLPIVKQCLKVAGWKEQAQAYHELGWGDNSHLMEQHLR